MSFRYTGDTSLIVDGVFSGQQYYFDRPGAVVAVDSRDRQSLLGVPILQPL